MDPRLDIRAAAERIRGMGTLGPDLPGDAAVLAAAYLAVTGVEAERDNLRAFKTDLDRLREVVRYWSYCTYSGMRRECPEKEAEFLSMCREFGVQPYAGEVP